MIGYCKTASAKAKLESFVDLKEQAAHLIIHSNYYPTRFVNRVNIYDRIYDRCGRLDMPFSSGEFDGVLFLDEL